MDWNPGVEQVYRWWLFVIIPAVLGKSLIGEN